MPAHGSSWPILTRKKLLLALLVLLCIGSILIGFSIGGAGISLPDVLQVLTRSANADPLYRDILWRVRFPRVIVAFLTGMALGASGIVMQSVLRNPLASSFTLGVSSGASLGAALVMLIGFSLFTPVLAMSIGGFLFGLLTVFLVLFISGRLSSDLDNQTVVLLGMVVSLFINAIVTVVMTTSPDRLQQIVFWQLGSFSGGTWSTVTTLAIITLAALVVLMLLHRELDLLTFGEEISLAMGVDVVKIKYLLIAIATLLTGFSVALVGIVGFIDLVAPHIARRLFGASHRWVLVSGSLVGGILCVLADIVSRTLLAPRELPVGAITALIGAPFFGYIYFRGSKSWSRGTKPPRLARRKGLLVRSETHHA